MECLSDESDVASPATIDLRSANKRLSYRDSSAATSLPTSSVLLSEVLETLQSSAQRSLATTSGKKHRHLATLASGVANLTNALVLLALLALQLL